MTAERRPQNPSGLLDQVLGGRARIVQARIVDKMTRADVRELALAIDEAVMFAVGSYAARVATAAAREESRLRDEAAARKAAVL